VNLIGDQRMKAEELNWNQKYREDSRPKFRKAQEKTATPYKGSIKASPPPLCFSCHFLKTVQFLTSKGS
jgi:hypothetical protein